MNKVAVRTHVGEQYVWYWCEGCQHHHGVPAKRWAWNGSLDRPTLSPSVRHFIPAGEGRSEKTVCHYFIREGQIEYCGDCDHEFVGRTVELLEPKHEDLPSDTGVSQ